MKGVTHLFRNQSGIAMLEFAFVFPILAIMVFGGMEISRLVLFHQKLDNATSGVANVITQLDTDMVACADLNNMQRLMRKAMQPFTFFNNGGTLIISGVEGRYMDDNDPNRDNKVVNQPIVWQWKEGGKNSKLGNKGTNMKGAAKWPSSFKRPPNNGGLRDSERVVAVEGVFDYKPLFPFLDDLIGLGQKKSEPVYKASFFRARFGNMGDKQNGC